MYTYGGGPSLGGPHPALGWFHLAANLPHDSLHPRLPITRSGVDEPIRHLPLR